MIGVKELVNKCHFSYNSLSNVNFQRLNSSRISNAISKSKIPNSKCHMQHYSGRDTTRRRNTKTTNNKKPFTKHYQSKA